MEVKDFVKFYPLRCKNIAWFLGAGASVSAGIRTAYDMIWDFKRIEYCAQHQYPISGFSDLANPAVRNQIQSYFDSLVDAPEFDSPGEYSYYFEKVYPNVIDRRDYIENMVSQVKPSYGHKVMGALMSMGAMRHVFTTNFDKAVENISAEFHGKVDSLYVASIENGASALKYMQGDKLPLLVKIHGDYHSQYLKNTREELREQDETLRAALLEACRRFGFAFMGYSGRDDSVLEVLEEALESESAFPQGLFWFIKSGGSVLPRVQKLISDAKLKGVDAHLIESETFDETLGDVIKAFPVIPSEILQKLDQTKTITKQKAPTKKGVNFPAISLNVVEITTFPSLARVVEVSTGNTKEVKEAVKESLAELTVIRRKEGVIGFGADSDFNKAFDSFGIKGRSLFTIPTHKLMYGDSSLKVLLIESLTKALIRGRPLKTVRRGSNYYIHIDPKELKNEELSPLVNLRYKVYGDLKAHNVFGIVPNTSLRWVDAVKVNLTYQYSTVYMSLDPTVLVQRTEDVEMRAKIGPFVKEQVAGRLNGPYNDLLNSWIKVLLKGQQNIDISTYGGVNGVDANFTISSRTSFTKLL